jgi:hypothetical protein
MATYQQVLPEVFPHILTVPSDQLEPYINLLTDPDRIASHRGSSFAVTMENHDGTVNLWLSEASLKYLMKYVPELS